MDNRIIKEIKKDNISVKIEVDPWSDHPLTLYDNIGEVICFGKHKDIGNEHTYENIDEFFIDLLDFPHMEIINYCLKNEFKYFTIEKKQQDIYWIKTYVMQYCVQYEIDGYCIVKLFFSRKPKIKYLFTIDTVKEIERKLKTTKSPYFTCWECGSKVHWLDVEGDINKKRDEFIETNYCGC